MNNVVRVCRLVTLMTLLASAPSAAQPLGVFRWQLQPYCNVVTFTVVQQGPAFTLTGIDDLCNAAKAAPAMGSAAPNPDGTIGMGFVVSTPGGPAAHLSATVTLPSASGTWRDADGHTGVFDFNGAVPGGQPCPAPTTSAVNTSAQLAASIFAGTGLATTLARSDHDHDSRYHPRAAVDARVPPQDSIALAGLAFEALGSSPDAAIGTACVRNPSSLGLTHVIPITAGSTVTGLTVRVYRRLVQSSSYRIAVVRQSPGTATGVSAFTRSVSFGGATGFHTHHVTLSEVADQGEAVYVTLWGDVEAYLCAVDVQFTRPS